MSPKPLTYSATFGTGMTPKTFTPNSAVLIEHFDTITDVLRPFRSLLASSIPSTNPATAKLTNFELFGTDLYAVGVDYSSPTYGALYKWSASSFDWLNVYSMLSASVPNAMLQAHSNYLFGLRNNRYIYRYDPALNTYSLSFYDATSVTYFADPITHSKDGICYIPLDNRIIKITSDGATPSLALTLPNSNYRITSICESGNYVNIVGYDLKSGVSSSLLWDRDTSVVDLTESYQLGTDKVYHNATLLGTTFFVQVREDVTASSFGEQPVLVVKYLNGNVPETLYEFPMTSFDVSGGSIGAKYISDDRMYFSARMRMIGESAYRHVVFCLNGKGKLTIAQNVDVDAGTDHITGLLRTGEGFWVSAGADGAWNTQSSYTTVSKFETGDIRSTDISQNISPLDLRLLTEPLPATGQVEILARVNEESAWTTIATFSGANKMKYTINALEMANSHNGLRGAKQARFRLQSTNGATITGFQIIFNEQPDQGNG